MDDGTHEDNLDAILRDLERWRDLLKQDLEPDARKTLERIIREAEDRLREIESARGRTTKPAKPAKPEG